VSELIVHSTIAELEKRGDILIHDNKYTVIKEELPKTDKEINEELEKQKKREEIIEEKKIESLVV